MFHLSHLSPNPTITSKIYSSHYSNHYIPHSSTSTISMPLSSSLPAYSSSPLSFSIQHPSSSSGYLQTSSRFWEFCIDGLVTYVRYGNVNGSKYKERATQMQVHATVEDANAFIEKLISEKLKNGFEGWVNW
ncbi:1664_t:CDS:1 [Paraglomus brasilianum]|uniref:1664_t:CDS:1 n=1 Tax=Paraglomus brasilianum TaxID=144538 RepID=A0A9N8WPG5_9GLOM|nr:1664_t:CDS:1 [Paraglomus brasilianum]